MRNKKFEKSCIRRMCVAVAVRLLQFASLLDHEIVVNLFLRVIDIG